MSNKTAWEKVEIARSQERKTALDYIEKIFDDFIELHGDRNFRDDRAIVCGLANIGEQNFTIIAEQKGRNTKENIERNFGMPNPESYRKAIRFMRRSRKIQYANNNIHRYQRSIPRNRSRRKRATEKP